MGLITIVSHRQPASQSLSASAGQSAGAVLRKTENHLGGDEEAQEPNPIKRHFLSLNF